MKNTKNLKTYLVLAIIIFLFLLIYLFFALANSEGHDINNWFFEKFSFLLAPIIYFFKFSPTNSLLINYLIGTILTSILYTIFIVYSFNLLKIINTQLDKM
jgi:hypothetical protein